MEQQVRYSFDAISLKKIAKGIWYSIAPAAITGAIMFLKDAQWESTLVSMAMPFLIMMIQTAGKQYIAGIPKDQVISNQPLNPIPSMEVKNGPTVESGGTPSGIDKSF